MATTTPNLGLSKPEVADKVNVSDLNENADLLDAIIGNLSDLNTAQKDSLVAAINEAMGPNWAKATMTGTVGQFISVSAVDDSGNVTAIAPVTIPNAEEASF